MIFDMLKLYNLIYIYTYWFKTIHYNHIIATSFVFSVSKSNPAMSGEHVSRNERCHCMAGYLPNGCITFIPRSLGVCQVELGTNFERIPSDNYSQFVLEKTICNIYIYVCVRMYLQILYQLNHWTQWPWPWLPYIANCQITRGPFFSYGTWPI